MLRVLAILLIFAPSAVGQPLVRGLAVKVEFTLEPTEITLGDEATLTLTIRNAFNPQQVTRPDLRKVEAFTRLFQITDVPGDAPKANAPLVKFTYRLRPRESGTIEMPRLAYTYLTPKDTENTALSQKGLTMIVKAPVQAPPAIVPVEGPEELFDLRQIPTKTRLDREPMFTSYWIWLLPLGPLLGLAWYMLWLRCYPDAATLSKLRRTRAARFALNAIQQATRSDDPSRGYAQAIREYLHDRLAWHLLPTTTDEVAALLEDGEATLQQRTETLAFLRRCDAARFSRTHDPALLGDAPRLIAIWEAP